MLIHLHREWNIIRFPLNMVSVGVTHPRYISKELQITQIHCCIWCRMRETAYFLDIIQTNDNAATESGQGEINYRCMKLQLHQGIQNTLNNLYLTIFWGKICRLFGMRILGRIYFLDLFLSVIWINIFFSRLCVCYN